MDEDEEDGPSELDPPHRLPELVQSAFLLPSD